MQNQNDSSSDGSSQGSDILISPTPRRTSSVNDKMDAIVNGNRYIPPQKRGTFPPIPERPESAMSNETFATQPPMEPFTPSKQGQSVHPTTGPTTPGTPSRYGPSQLNQQFARLESGLNTPRTPPSVQRSNGSISGSGRRGFYNGGARPGFGGSNNGSVGSTPIRSANRSSNNSSIDGTPTRSANRSSDDSPTVASTKGHHIARMIMSGATDDPKGVDFGNPGPSRDPRAVYKALAASRPSRSRVAAAAGQESNKDSLHTDIRNGNIRGNPTVYLGKTEDAPPAWFDDLEDGILPDTEQVYADLPLVEACRAARPSTAGVIRIINIPYATSRAEIVAFLGKNAQIVSQPVGTPFMAIHIMMDRLSGKTLDAFIEVESEKEAKYITNQFARRAAQGRHIKLGDRPVAVVQSSQGEFMRELFPRTKNVTWHGPVPKIDEDLELFYEGVASTGFIGFFKTEETAHMIKHVEMPQRSPYAVRNIVRPYECIISTVHKYPWFDIEHILLSERDNLFKVVLAAVDALIEILAKIGGNAARHDPTKPTSMTLKELAIAGLTCPGFSEAQKSRIIRHLMAASYGQYAIPKGLNVTFGGTDVFSAVWPFQILVKKPGVSDGLMEYVAGLLRDAAIGPELSVNNLDQQHSFGNPVIPFGHLDINYDGVQTIGDVGRLELRAIHKLLKLALAHEDDNDDPFTLSHRDNNDDPFIS